MIRVSQKAGTFRLKSGRSGIFCSASDVLRLIDWLHVASRGKAPDHELEIQSGDAKISLAVCEAFGLIEDLRNEIAALDHDRMRERATHHSREVW